MCLAVPGKILSVRGSNTMRTGTVSFGGVSKEACLAFVPEAKVGDYVLVHAEQGRAEVENQYARSVVREGNRPAQELMSRVFRVVARKWRGVGEIPHSGFALRDEFAAYDAETRFGVAAYHVDEDSECLSGQVLRGVKKPRECPAFGTRCTPERPLGATMVSSEGACAAYYQYRRHERTSQAATKRASDG